MAADGWPDPDPQFDCISAARALMRSIESADGDVIVRSARVLLGAKGIAAHAVDVAKIVQSGRLPLTVLLVEQCGRDIAMLATTVALDAATVH